mgnify:CR=1 FL=1
MPFTDNLHCLAQYYIPAAYFHLRQISIPHKQQGIHTHFVNSVQHKLFRRGTYQDNIPDPKTSGGARWNYLAAWAYADKLYNGDETQIEAFIKKLYENVLVLDSGARGATTSFVENNQGDVLIAWENEAFLSVQENPDEYEIVTPSISILAQPSVAVVDEVVDQRGTRDVAAEYLSYLYSDKAQRIAGDNFYRPSNPDILNEYADTFDLNINLVTIQDFGGWDEVQKKHFDDGGVFDRIYEKTDK